MDNPTETKPGTGAAKIPAFCACCGEYMKGKPKTRDGEGDWICIDCLEAAVLEEACQHWRDGEQWRIKCGACLMCRDEPVEAP